MTGLGFAQTTVTYDFSAGGAVTGLNESSPGITVDSDPNIGFGSFKNSGTSNPALNSGQLRLYQEATKGGSIIIYANNGVTITDIVVNASSRTGDAGYTVDEGSATNLSGGSTYSISGISASSEVEFYQRESGSGNRIYIDSFTVTYTTPATCSAPTSEATAFSASNVTTDAATLSWTRGIDGDNVIVIMKEGAAVDFSPSSETAYGANTDFSSGTELGTGNYVIYNGAGTSEAITGLASNTIYYIAIYEYNNTDTCYMSTALTDSFTTLANTTVEFTGTTASVSESIGSYDLVIEIANEDVAATTFDVVLTSGDATDIDSYTTQSKTFLGSSTTDITVTITVTDDAIIENDEVFTFEIQNVAGGNSAAAGTNNTFDLTITNNDFPTIVEFISSSTSVSEGVGNYDLEFTIANESATATSFDVVLTGGDGDAADINGYTTQTVTFPSGSAVNQIVTLTVSDDTDFEADETLIFEIQNITGGSSAVVGTNNSFTLTLTNNDITPPITLPYNEDFSNCGSAEWTPFDEAGNDEWICSGDEYAINGYSGTDDTDWLISDFTIDFSAYSSVKIDVTTQERYGDTTNTPGEFDLLYSTDYTGGDPTTATWTALTFNPNNSSSSGTLSTASITSVNASSIIGTAYLAFKYDMNFSGSAEDWRIQNIDIYEDITLDSDTEVYDPTSQVAATTITAADATTSGTAVDVFGFEVGDQGTTDGEPTNITTMRFVPGPNNTADWTDHIQGVTLLDENAVSYAPTTSITDTEIVLTFGSPIVVSDGTTLEFILGLYLNTTSIIDGSVIQLQIDEASSGFAADASGSDFVDPFLFGDVVGNNMIIDVDATELVFSQQPSDTELNIAMSPAITVSGVDANGNLDTDYNLDVDITSTGTLSGSPVTATAVDGIATFATLTHTVAGSGLVLTADDGVLSTTDSTPFEITEPIVGAADLFFSEYIEGSSNNKYIEIYNGTGATVTLTDYSVELYANGNSSPNNTEDFSSGFPATLANGDVIVLENSSATIYGGTAYSSSVCNFNGDDAIVLKKGSDIIDIIGNIGCDPGSQWTEGSNDTSDRTLVRNADVCGGITVNPSVCTFPTLESEWTGYSQDTISNLGSHTATCGAPTTYTYNGTWSPNDPNGTATANDAIVITSGNAIISSDTDINSVTVNLGASLTIDTGATLTVTDAITLESVSNSYSSLILDGTIAGTINYERHVNGNTLTGDTNAIGENDLITPPLSGQTFGDFATANSNLLANPGDASEKAFAIFDKSTGDYENYNTTDNASTLLVAGKGYRAASSNTSTLIFTGDANSGDININIDHSGSSYQEWNLIGNPYPSYLDINAFLNYVVDTVDGTDIKNIDLLGDTSGIYGYDGDASDNWDIINLANASGRLMTPGQGFLVGADATYIATHDLEFKATMRTTGSGDDFIVGRNANTLTYFKLNTSTTTHNYTTQFYFNANATLGLDAGYDAAIWGGTAPNFALFSHLVEDNNGLPIALQTLDVTDLANVTIPLGVNANQGEQLTFSINASTLPSTVSVYLDDNVANTSTLLNTNDYVLTPSNALSGTGRFYLRVSNSTLSTIDNTLDQLSIYTDKADKTIVIAGQLLEPTTASVYDVQGRLVSTTLLQTTVRSQAIDVSNLSHGIYVVKLHNAAQNKTQKVILR